MIRDYESGVSNTPIIFVGEEVESSPFKGEKTLFVVGLQPIYEIIEIAKKEKATHVYLTANHSWVKHKKASFELMAKEILKSGLKVTIETPFNEIVEFLDEIAFHENFCHMISVAIPNLTKYGRNATIKIDDADFNFSNRGVWVSPINEMPFTPWDVYGKDKVIR